MYSVFKSYWSVLLDIHIFPHFIASKLPQILPGRSGGYTSLPIKFKLLIQNSALTIPASCLVELQIHTQILINFSFICQVRFINSYSSKMICARTMVCSYDLVCLVHTHTSRYVLGPIGIEQTPLEIEFQLGSVLFNFDLEHTQRYVHVPRYILGQN